MTNRRDLTRTPAKLLAERLNVVPIALFSLWLGPMLLFWAQAFGPLRSFGTPPPALSALPWLTASVIMGAFILKLPASWYRLHPFEASGRIHKMLGAVAFRAFVTNGDFINRAVARRYPNYRVYQYGELLESVSRNSFVSERSHLVAFALESDS